MLKIRALFLNVAGIGLIYVMCYCYGLGLQAGRPMDANIRFVDVIEEAAKTHNVHPALIAAVIHVESNFNPKARSHRGAKGLMQINSPTQRYLKIRDIYDVRANVDAGTRYLRELLNKFDGDILKALASYNAGPGAVSKYADVPPYRETRQYIKKVLVYFRHYRGTIMS